MDPRHIGDIPIDYYSFADQPIVWSGFGSLPVVPRGVPNPNRRADFSYMLIDKGKDETTTPLRMAWTNGKKFPSGELVIEQVTQTGQLIKTTTFKMRSLVVEAWENHGHRDTIGFQFESMTVGR